MKIPSAYYEDTQYGCNQSNNNRRLRESYTTEFENSVLGMMFIILFWYLSTATTPEGMNPQTEPRDMCLERSLCMTVDRCDRDRFFVRVVARAEEGVSTGA